MRDAAPSDAFPGARSNGANSALRVRRSPRHAAPRDRARSKHTYVNVRIPNRDQRSRSRSRGSSHEMLFTITADAVLRNAAPERLDRSFADPRRSRATTRMVVYRSIGVTVAHTRRTRVVLTRACVNAARVEANRCEHPTDRQTDRLGTLQTWRNTPCTR